MGYENVEDESLATLFSVITAYLRDRKKETHQGISDAQYELKRIDDEKIRRGG